MHVRTADFDVDYADIRRLRVEVFVEEQGVPEELELDDRDAECTHVLAFDNTGAAVGTGRIDVDGRIGRVAVIRAARRTGVGRAMMDLLHRVARERGLAEVWCHAQITAQRFYERLGYTQVGGVFLEAGIEHVEMRRRTSGIS
jgi:predicted GNAT family N-acyltransferase